MRPSNESVRQLMYDDFATEQALAPAFYVKTDVQGADPAVARGMAKSLSAKNLTLLSFEYSQHWPQGDSLRRFAADMLSRGYSTYLVHGDAERRRTSLMPVSGDAWDDSLEMCTAGGPRCVVDTLVVRDDSPTKAQLLRLTNGW